MRIDDTNYRTIWIDKNDDKIIKIIDQKLLPHEFRIKDLKTSDEAMQAIIDMNVRGAGLIGATAAYGMYLGTLEAKEEQYFYATLQIIGQKLKSTRPTAINLAWAVDNQLKEMRMGISREEMVLIAKENAKKIADDDALGCKSIGIHGVSLIEEIAKKKRGEAVNILTHCNAGWLAFVDYGSATAPIYEAHKRGIKLHVWVDETRPWNQGSKLTAFELYHENVPHTIIADNTGGHLMQHGLVDLVIVGTDRTTYTGDVANKIGTYLKALAAKDNNIPFYAAVPTSSFDWKMRDGINEIAIEKRSGDEVRYAEGLLDGKIKRVLIAPEKSDAVNYGFDVTPSRLLTGLITERGICRADEKSILGLFPEHNVE